MEFRTSVRAARSLRAKIRKVLQLKTRVVCVFVSYREMGGNAMHFNCLQTLNGG